MLEAIRTRLSGWVSFVIIGFIGLALVISFGNMDSGINPELVVAEVNGEEISVQQLRQSLDSQVKRYQDATGQDVPPFLKAQLAQSEFLKPGDVTDLEIISSDGSIDLGKQRNEIADA